jgi:peptidoglycan/xylan/chitin deacetylase (PgdA/CDA1 family)
LGWGALALGLVAVAGLCAALARAYVPTPSPGLITHGPRDRRVIALTFDADMTPTMIKLLHERKVRGWYDRRITAELRATHTPATIFLTGLWAKTYPADVRNLAADPLFELDNHSYDHAAWASPCYGLVPLRTALEKQAEVTRTARVLEQVAGIHPRYFRFPGGCQNEADVRLVKALGELPVQWDVVSGDAFLRDSSTVEHEVLRQVQPGSIIVMHLMGAPATPATAEAVRALIPELKARGYRFVKLHDLLGP